MNRIQEVFKNKKAFIPFITAGDPDLKVTEELVAAMAEAGADLIELGIPFSDPVAEGIVIQEADMRALASGTTTDKIFDSVRRIRQKTDVPLAFMTYINPVFAYGVDKFMKNASDCGIDALIVPDMPFEEREELLPACKKYGMVLIYLVAPTSKERAQAIARESEGFVYCVSSLGVTGVRSQITTNIKEMVDTVKQARQVPCAVGFGISTPEQAREMAAQSDGVIVGSAIVKMVAQYGSECVEPVCSYVRQMKAAVGG
ncbi:tryptophan synthase subunit alpha [Enterocloster aldenensis]|uniref:tryptophan synthase subunit alpha n=1 Tax=Enterocloster aldenensis TaxID=358742 RepID=UPI000E4A0B67|nr:tryptophan synthase subunit alpha [Enterocloster aldenensis]